VPLSPAGWVDFQPKVSPATGAVVTGHEAVLTMTHIEGYSPSVFHAAYRRWRECPECPGQRVSDPPAPTMAWAAASRATGTRNGEQET
jgi:hypothetical protein